MGSSGYRGAGGPALAAVAIITVMLLASPPSQAAEAPCTTVRVGDTVVPPIDCLNDRFAAMAKAEQMRKQLAITPPQDTLGAPDHAGAETYAGASLRFGTALGVSPTPNRPASTTTDSFSGHH